MQLAKAARHCVQPSSAAAATATATATATVCMTAAIQAARGQRQRCSAAVHSATARTMQPMAAQASARFAAEA
ncbi:hypothetical protein SLS62_011443 [Diatrype stigma]|uniref:Uncharacterized protein n=1 Tax=Diatrype stigma TaxID=117547 RepID=A0AAN9U223_9PEZI